MKFKKLTSRNVRFSVRFQMLFSIPLFLILTLQPAIASLPKVDLSTEDGNLMIKKIEISIPLSSEYGTPISMAKGDFNGDGSVDIMIGYANGNKGSLVLLGGKLLSQYPRWNELGESEKSQQMAHLFLKPQQVLNINVIPEILFAGDFDADGLFDVAITQLGSESLYYAANKGNGHFEKTIKKKLAGKVVNIAMGEWQRPDGLADFLIELRSEKKSSIQLLQGNSGAILATMQPALLSNNFSLEEYTNQGMTLKTDNISFMRQRPESPEQHHNFISTQQLTKTIKTKNAKLIRWLPDNPYTLTNQTNTEKAVEYGGVTQLSMRLSLDAIADTVVLTSAPNPQLKIVLGVPVAIITVNDTGDENLRDGLLTLREAIMLAEGSLIVTTLDAAEASQVVGIPASSQLDQINFDISGVGPHIINILSELPTMSDSIVIDGTSEPDFIDKPIVNIDGSMDNTGGSGISALRVAGGNSTIRGLVINNLLLGTIGGSAIVLTNQGNNIVEGNFIGTDPTGTMDMGNGGNGVQIVNSDNNLIGGSTGVAVRNIISGMGYGAISIEGPSSIGNRIEGNYLGTDITSTLVIGNDSNNIDIKNGASQNVIGGLIDGTENVISGNLTIDFPNIVISRGGTGNPDPAANVFQGNYIGTDITGTVGLGNASVGVFMTGGANNNQVGGAAVGAGNVISSSGLDGIRLAGSAYSNFVSGNWIGTDITGMANLGNSSHGVFLQQLNFGAGGTIIGGIELGAGNIIAYNGGDGVFVDNGSGSRIQGNYIFSNADLAIDLCESFNATTQGCDDIVSVNVNDGGDADVGANDLLNFPVLNKVLNNLINTNTLFSGSYNGLANALIDIELFSNSTCDSSGFGEAENPLGITQITTDASGNADFSINLTTNSLQNKFITASASDSGNNTSELSSCAEVLSEIVFQGGFEG